MPKLGAVQFLNFKNDRFDQEGKTFKEATQRACYNTLCKAKFGGRSVR